MYFVILDKISRDRYDPQQNDNVNTVIYIFDNVNDANVKQQNTPNSRLIHIPNGSNLDSLGQNVTYTIYDSNVAVLDMLG